MYIILLLTLFTFCGIKLCSRVSQMVSTNLCLTFGQLSLIFNVLVDPSWCNIRTFFFFSLHIQMYWLICGEIAGK